MRARRDEATDGERITVMRTLLASLLIVTVIAPASAQETRNYDIKPPTGPWRTPGEIQQPKGTWQQPGEIKVPKGLQAVRAVETGGCERRLSVVADALFDFNKSNLRSDAEETLTAAGPEI